MRHPVSVGVDHRRSGDGGPEFLIGGVNNPALRSEGGSGLSQSALRQANSGSSRDDRRDFAQRQSVMIMKRERLSDDIGAGTVRGRSVLTGCKAYMPTPSRPPADVATAVLHMQEPDAADR
jgi:hypothetical protein